MLRLSVENLTPSCLMVSAWPKVLAHVDLLNPNVLVAPQASESCFIVVTPPGHQLSMSSIPDRGQVRLEVDHVVQAIVNIRVENVAVCFHGSNMFAIRVF